jgi:hypothetical protein
MDDAISAMSKRGQSCVDQPQKGPGMPQRQKVRIWNLIATDWLQRAGWQYRCAGDLIRVGVGVGVNMVDKIDMAGWSVASALTWGQVVLAPPSSRFAPPYMLET